jgi:hypothetical protein
MQNEATCRSGSRGQSSDTPVRSVPATTRIKHPNVQNEATASPKHCNRDPGRRSTSEPGVMNAVARFAKRSQPKIKPLISFVITFVPSRPSWLCASQCGALQRLAARAGMCKTKPKRPRLPGGRLHSARVRFGTAVNQTCNSNRDNRKPAFTCPSTASAWLWLPPRLWWRGIP